MNTVKKTKRGIYLLDKAKTLPEVAGCYLMKSTSDKILYVGKAKNLKKRVKSYFDSSAKTLKTTFLVSHIHDFEFIVTQTDAEALVLENNLIKEHSPKYNVRMKDDKSYPYIVIDTDEPFPRVKYLRRPQRKNGRIFFGPFPYGASVSQLAKVLTKTFKLRDCTLSEMKRRKKPCLLYQMNQCSAPCVDYISEENYDRELSKVKDILLAKNKAKKVIREVHEQMMNLATKEEFEKASIIRDHLEVFQNYIENTQKQNVEFIKDEKDVDIIAYYAGEEEIDISIYMVRSGLLIGQKNLSFLNSGLIENTESEVISYLMQYYTQTAEILPQYIYSDFEEDNISLFEKALNTSLEREMKIKIPKGRFREIYQLTQTHAQEAQRVRMENQESVFVALNKLQALLSLKERPRVIECYDVAIWQGSSPTASQIVFTDGKPDKNKYRYYHLQEREEGNNDFAMMKEVISRRIEHDDLPDLFLIDGGKAQVSVVCAVLKELNKEIPVVGIAKAKTLAEKDYKKNNEKTQERLIIPGRANPFFLEKSPSLLKLCVAMRDEAHRFSRKLHHKQEKKRLFHSWLDEVEGIGNKTKQKIMRHKHFSKESMRELSAEHLAALFGIQKSAAQRIKNYLEKLI